MASEDLPSNPLELTGGFQFSREGNWRSVEWLATVRLINGRPGLAPASDCRAASSVQGWVVPQDELLYVSMKFPSSLLYVQGWEKERFLWKLDLLVLFSTKISPGQGGTQRWPTSLWPLKGEGALWTASTPSGCLFMFSSPVNVSKPFLDLVIALHLLELMDLYAFCI